MLFKGPFCDRIFGQLLLWCFQQAAFTKCIVLPATS